MADNKNKEKAARFKVLERCHNSARKMIKGRDHTTWRQLEAEIDYFTEAPEGLLSDICGVSLLWMLNDGKTTQQKAGERQ